MEVEFSFDILWNKNDDPELLLAKKCNLNDKREGDISRKVYDKAKNILKDFRK